MNPIINMMQNPFMAMFQPLLGAMQASQDPLGTLTQAAAKDERMRSVVDTIRQNGGIQQAVYAEAQKKNVNPNDVLNQAQQLMQSLMSK